MDHKSAAVENQIMFVIQTLLTIGVSQPASYKGEDSAQTGGRAQRAASCLGECRSLGLEGKSGGEAGSGGEADR